MVNRLGTFAAFLAFFFAPNAWADHHDGELSVAHQAETLALTSAHLANLAGPFNGALAQAADRLHADAEGYAAFVDATGVVTGNVLNRDHRPDAVTFAQVERDFWRLAHLWNANAVSFSQVAPLRTSYTDVTDNFRELLLNVYNIAP